MEKLDETFISNRLAKRTWAEIDLDRLCSNYNKFNELAKKSALDFKREKPAEIMAIVKSDGYGHGVGYVARTLRDLGAKWFGVADLDEAVQLREEGIEEDILILGYTHPRAVPLLLEMDFTQTVFSLEYALQLDDEVIKYHDSKQSTKKLKVHIKVDTGMSRLGVFCQEDSEDKIDGCAREIVAITRLENLAAHGIFTHFACADEADNDRVTLTQYRLFTTLLGSLETDYKTTFNLRHCCNTAGAMRFPDMHMDIVRIGIGLFGLYPDAWMERCLKLEPVMALKSVVSMIKTVPKNTAVSYNHIYSTDSERVLATIPIGYADGYSRGLGGKSHILVKGEKAPIVGRICMDQCLADVTGIAGVSLGDTVTIFGTENGEYLPVDCLAKHMDTINYEFVCLIGKRVPRVFCLKGEQIGIINYILSARSL